MIDSFRGAASWGRRELFFLAIPRMMAVPLFAAFVAAEGDSFTIDVWLVIAGAAVYTTGTLLIALSDAWWERFDQRWLIVPDLIVINVALAANGGPGSPVAVVLFVWTLAMSMIYSPRMVVFLAILGYLSFLLMSVPFVFDSGGIDTEALRGVAIFTLSELWIAVVTWMTATSFARREARIGALSEARGRLVADALSAEDRARRRLSQRLHDDALQTLLAAGQDLDAGITAGEPMQLERAREEMRSAVRSLRETIRGLHPAALAHGGLSGGLDVVVEQAARLGGFEADLRVDPEASSAHDSLLVSVIRELTTNAAKHADRRCGDGPGDPRSGLDPRDGRRRWPRDDHRQSRGGARAWAYRPCLLRRAHRRRRRRRSTSSPARTWGRSSRSRCRSPSASASASDPFPRRPAAGEWAVRGYDRVVTANGDEAGGDAGRLPRSANMWSMRAARKLRRKAQREGEPLQAEDWMIFWELSDSRAGRGMHRFLHALPGHSRCQICSAPFEGGGSFVARRLGYRPSRKNPTVCAACVENSPPGGATMDVGVLFADLRGFTSRSEGADPSEVSSLLRRFYGCAERTLFPEGVIDKLIGDAVMALYLPILLSRFPAGVGATMLRQAQDLLEEVGYGTDAGPFAEVGVGIDYGEAFVGNIGDRAVYDFTAVGDVVNTASRLQGQAGGGEIVLSDRVAALLDAPVGEAVELELKGKSEPQRGFRIAAY